MSTDSLAGVVSKVSRFDGDGTLRSYVTLEPLPKSDFVATRGLTEDATANAHVIEMQWRSIDDASNFTDDDTTAQTLQPKKTSSPPRSLSLQKQKIEMKTAPQGSVLSLFKRSRSGTQVKKKFGEECSQVSTVAVRPFNAMFTCCSTCSLS